MALYTRHEPADVSLLLATGFTTRLRVLCGRGEKYLGVSESGQLRCVASDDASTVEIYGGRCGSTLAAVRLSEQRYIDVDNAEGTCETPMLVRIETARYGGVGIRIAFCTTRKPNRYLVLSDTGVATMSVETPPEHVCLELVMSTTVAQACMLATLAAGTRFRLRSVHGRVLYVQDGHILQDGAVTEIEEAGEKDLVLEVIRHGDDWYLQDVNSTKFLYMQPQNQPLLSLVNDANTAFRFHPHNWGAMHIGVDDDKGTTEWLMGGMRGRLESRRHTRGWEVFRVEYVEQALRRVKEEVENAVYAEAEKLTKERMRAAVRADVEKARIKKKSTSPFNHARALAALSEPQPNSTNQVKESGREREVHAATKRDTMTAPVVAGSSLPRVAQNRKLTKREKRKKRKAAAAAKAATAASAVVAAPSVPVVSGASVAPDEDKKKATEVAENVDVSKEGEQRGSGGSVSSAAAVAASNVRCGACGRGIVGGYTEALGKSFHPGCLVCVHCRCTLSGSGKLHMHKGSAFCERCYRTHAASRCSRCTMPIMGTVVTAMDRTWHRECLTCVYCRHPLTETFWVYADRPREPHCNECVGTRAQPTTTNRRHNAPFSGATLGAGGSLGAPSGSARMHMPISRPNR